jgi:hypothetical protein
MGKAERERAKAALEHALAALGDGAGHTLWGPGVVGNTLWRLRETKAGLAFDTAASVLFRMELFSVIRPDERPRFIAAMSKIAPVLLEVLLGDEE